MRIHHPFLTFTPNFLVRLQIAFALFAVLLTVLDRKAPILRFILNSAYFWALLLNSDFEKRLKKFLKSVYLAQRGKSAWVSNTGYLRQSGRPVCLPISLSPLWFQNRCFRLADMIVKTGAPFQDVGISERIFFDIFCQLCNFLHFWIDFGPTKLLVLVNIFLTPLELWIYQLIQKFPRQFSEVQLKGKAK